MKVRDLPPQLPVVSELFDKPDHFLLGGESSIIGPDGRYIVEPVFNEEQIIVAEVDLKTIDRERLTLNVSGHYQRADLFDIRVNPISYPSEP